MYRLVTCPESAHLELIEYDETPVGMVIRACSRFRPPHEVTCARTCAARLDQAARTRNDNSPTERVELPPGSTEIDDPD